jgi:hypothetical protein
MLSSVHLIGGITQSYQFNVGASVKVNIIDKVTIIDNVSAVKIRHGRWQASSSLFPTLFGG